MAKRRTAILSFLAALTLVLSVGVVVRAAPDASASNRSTDAIQRGDRDDNDNDDNRDECKGGTLTHPTPTTTKCTISQTTTGGNHAECKLFSERPDATQICDITQTGTTGNNHVRVRMRIAQETTLPATSNSCDALRTGPPPGPPPSSNQNACQILIVKQTSDSGSNSLDGVLRITQEIENGTTQRQNAGQQHDIVNQISKTGAALAKLNLFQTQKEEAEAVANLFQRSTARGHITQNFPTGTGIARYDRSFTPRQVQRAPAGSILNQDPDDFCCSSQGPNLNNIANIVTSASSIASLATAQQQDRLVGNTRPTGGKGSVQLTAFFQRGGTTNTFTNNCGPTQGGCSRAIFIACGVEGCVPIGD